MPTALITGTSTGIGLETALHFARQGYQVFAGARNPAAVEFLHATTCCYGDWVARQPAVM